MNAKGVIIQGSARSGGNTGKIVSLVQQQSGFEVIDLAKFSIGPFDYDFKHADDDFLPLIREIVDNYGTIVFATPVYWYAMSGIMKNFFDRITDCLKVEKEVGRKLRGKSMAMISCGSGPELQEGFSMPFSESANYLGMNYLGDIHTWLEEESIPGDLQSQLEAFVSNSLLS